MILTVYSQSGGEESNEFICINLVSNIQFYFIPHVLFLNCFSLCLRGGATELKEKGVDEKEVLQLNMKLEPAA